MVGTYQSWVGGGGGFGGRSGGFGGGGSLTGSSSTPYSGGARTPADIGAAADWRTSQAQGTASAYPNSSQLNPNIGRWAVDAARVALTPPPASSPYAINPYSTMAGQALATAQFAPQTLQALMSQDQLKAQMGTVGANEAFGRGVLQRSTALDRQQLGLQSQGVGVDRNLINTQIGLQGENYANQLRQLGMDEAQVRDLSERRMFEMRSNLTARGAMGTVAQPRGTGNIERDLGYELAGIGNKRTGADISNRGALAGLNSSLANLGIKAQQIGLSDKQLTNALSDGLAKLGMDSDASIKQIQAAIDSGDIGMAQLGQQIITQAITNSQFFASMSPAQQQQILAAFGIKKPGNPAPLRTGL